MTTHVISELNHLSLVVLHQIAVAGSLDEISNFPGAVRHHIFQHGNRDKAANTLRQSMLFFIYQTGRHGPQNGFRLCLIHRGFHIASGAKVEGEAKDDIDRLEKNIPNGHMEVVVVGPPPAVDVDNEEE
jgi:hypothetical protein